MSIIDSWYCQQCGSYNIVGGIATECWQCSTPRPRISAVAYRTPACGKHLSRNDEHECPWCKLDEYEHREKLHMDRCRHDMERIARLEQQLADITGKHDIACFTIADLQKERERLREQLDEYSDVLRGLASYVGCGGYNSYGRIAPKVAEEKIRRGIDHLLSVRRRVGELESKLDQCLRVVREYVSSELADDPSQDDPSCQLYPLIELVRKRPGR